LTLCLFSHTKPSDITYATSLFPGLDTIDSFLEYCAQRAPEPWADGAVVYLLRLSKTAQTKGRLNHNDTSTGTEVEIDELDNDDDYDVEGVGEVIGHVSLAHSLESRQPRVLSSPSSTKGSSYASNPPHTTIVPDVGWRLRPAYQRQGYATEALERFLAYLCEEDTGPRFEVVCVFTGEGNVRSLALAGRVGFVCAMGEDQDGDEEGGSNGGDEGKEDGGGGYGEEEAKEGFKGVLGCERVMKGIWFGVRPAGWRWEEGRKNRELKRCIEKLFE